MSALHPSRLGPLSIGPQLEARGLRFQTAFLPTIASVGRSQSRSSDEDAPDPQRASGAR